MNLWVISPEIVNNDTPTFKASANPDWSFDGQTISGPNTVVSVSGPHAVSCGSQDLISLFATPPITYSFVSGGDPVVCNAPSTG